MTESLMHILPAWALPFFRGENFLRDPLYESTQKSSRVFPPSLDGFPEKTSRENYDRVISETYASSEKRVETILDPIS